MVNQPIKPNIIEATAESPIEISLLQENLPHFKQFLNFNIEKWFRWQTETNQNSVRDEGGLFAITVNLTDGFPLGFMEVKQENDIGKIKWKFIMVVESQTNKDYANQKINVNIKTNTITLEVVLVDLNISLEPQEQDFIRNYIQRYSIDDRGESFQKLSELLKEKGGMYSEYGLSAILFREKQEQDFLRLKEEFESKGLHEENVQIEALATRLGSQIDLLEKRQSIIFLKSEDCAKHIQAICEVVGLYCFWKRLQTIPADTRKDILWFSSALVEFRRKQNLAEFETNLNGNQNESGNERKCRELISEKVRIYVWRRDQGKCVKCGSQERLEFDHIIPFSKGGSNTERNIQLLCEKCNREKRDNI